MQTFLPYADFQLVAKTLDYKRLGKQRSECKQINKALRGEYKTAWVHHPATLMWKGYEVYLCEYAIAICEEWRNRGYQDAQLPYFWNQRLYWESIREPIDISWLNNESIFQSHRSNLLRKNFDYYSKFGWKETDNLPYVWPAVKE